MKTPIRETVMFHGFIELDEDNNLCRTSGKPMVSQEHTDDIRTADGWNVWLRRDCADGPFDSDDAWEADFKSFTAAYVYARAVAEELDIEIDTY